jgi:hypothetical protein
VRPLCAVPTLLAVLGVAACGGSDGESPPSLRQIGSSGVTTSAACGDQLEMDAADIVARTSARVVAARLIDASPGFHLSDFAGYVEPDLPEGGKTTSSEGEDSVIVVTLPDVPPAGRPRKGLVVSRDEKHPTVLALILDATCPPGLLAGRENAELTAHKVEITVEAGGRTSKQTLTTDLTVCVGKTAPDNCP